MIAKAKRSLDELKAAEANIDHPVSQEARAGKVKKMFFVGENRRTWSITTKMNNSFEAKFRFASNQ